MNRRPDILATVILAALLSIAPACIKAPGDYLEPYKVQNPKRPTGTHLEQRIKRIDPETGEVEYTYRAVPNSMTAPR